MNTLRFFRCEHCGNIVEMVEDKGVRVVCCGQDMTELVPNTSDGASEKHVPVVKADSNKVTVNIGSVAHPMLPEHHIAWVVLETENTTQRRYLDPQGKPEAVFALTDGDKVIAAYEYCNIHGFWKVSL